MIPREQWADYLVDYLKNYQGQIDRLFCFGLYPDYGPALAYFKEHFNGKIILKLDANSYWMDVINYQESPHQEMITACDLISCEGRAMQNYLAKKWNRPIELIRNGFQLKSFNFQLSFTLKENIILNVGRQEVGRKNTATLIKVFAQLAPDFPDWKLILIGTYETAIKALVEFYYHSNPQLKKQLLLTGPIADKKILEEYYAKAKVFATASHLEGGSPNVVGEALRNGCYLITSKIDAWQDTFAKGAGASFDHGDLDGLKAELRKALSQPQLLAAAFDKNQTYCRQELIYESKVRRYQLLLDSAWR